VRNVLGHSKNENIHFKKILERQKKQKSLKKERNKRLEKRLLMKNKKNYKDWRKS